MFHSEQGRPAYSITFHCRRELNLSPFKYIESLYNKDRPHSTNDFLRLMKRKRDLVESDKLFYKIVPILLIMAQLSINELGCFVSVSTLDSYC